MLRLCCMDEGQSLICKIRNKFCNYHKYFVLWHVSDMEFKELLHSPAHEGRSLIPIIAYLFYVPIVSWCGFLWFLQVAYMVSDNIKMTACLALKRPSSWKGPLPSAECAICNLTINRTTIYNHASAASYSARCLDWCLDLVWVRFSRPCTK